MDWQGSPVLTTVKSTSYPVNKIEFPTLTICGQGSNEVVFNAGKDNDIHILKRNF
jgi:hypothetical protein